MGQRNMPCAFQMPFLEPHNGLGHFYPDYCMLQGNIVTYQNRSMNQVIHTSGNTADPDLNRIRELTERSMLYGNSYDIIQHNQHAINADFTVAGQSSSGYPHPFPSSSGRLVSIPRNDGSMDNPPSTGNLRSIGASLEHEDGRHDHLVDSVRGSCKRKNAEVVPGNYNHINGSTSSSSSAYLSLNSGQQQLNGACDSGINFLDATSFTIHGNWGNHSASTSDGSHRSVRCRSSLVNLHPESAMMHHNNHVIQGNLMGQSIQPGSNSWTGQYANNIGDGGYSNWNDPHSITPLQGRCLSSRDAAIMNVGVQGYQETPCTANSAFLFHPASMPTFHQHIAPLHNLPVQSFGHHTHSPAPPYQLPLQNVYPGNASATNPSLDVLDSSYRFVPFPPSNEMLYGLPRHQIPTAVEVNRRNLRILSPEDAAVLEFSGFYGVGDVTDQHRDMRLDIDNMSYEELLALEEQIGDVGIGLTEEFILKNLKTAMHAPYLVSSQSDWPSRCSPENENCAICQVEYEENERLGSLDCGHKYHADCIKQWLLIKNVCPICKTSALATNKL